MRSRSQTGFVRIVLALATALAAMGAFARGSARRLSARGRREQDWTARDPASAGARAFARRHPAARIRSSGRLGGG